MSDTTDHKLPLDQQPLDEKAPSYEEAVLEEAPSKQLNEDPEAQADKPKRKCRKALWIVLGLLFLSPAIGMSIDACNEMMVREANHHHGKHGKHGNHGNHDNEMMPAGDRHGKHGMVRGRPHGMMRPGNMPCDDDKQETQTVRVHYILPNGEHKVAEIHGGRFFPGRPQEQVEEAESEDESDSDSDSDSDDEEETIQVAPVPQVE
ncbi:hypothetical protein CKK34_0743 [Yarrowia sp. E02]|nr:hypothetical protein CKK34_0743 [Yarrowia sp. E02]